MVRNLNERPQGRRFKRISPIFKGDIFMTKKLNFRYLWIVSLCIIQENDEDWRNEAKNMSQFYRSAVLNIAVEGNTEQHGFLHPRHHSIMEAIVPMPYIDQQRVRQGCFYFYQTDQSLEQRYWSAVRKNILMSRGCGYFKNGP